MDTVIGLIVIVFQVRGTIIIFRGTEANIGQGLRVAIGVSMIIVLLALMN